MSTWDGRLPGIDVERKDWTLDQIDAVIELREHELRTEGCITLILPDLESLRRLKERREAGQ